MYETLSRCSICKSFLDSEDLFCSNCGTEGIVSADISDNKIANAQTASRHSFECDNCGASMSYDASAQSLRCPFCGSTKMTSKPDSRVLKPSIVVPMSVPRDQADPMLRQWLTRGFWRPGDAAKMSAISELTAVYVPYWVFSAEAYTYWTADSSPAPAGARGDWYPLSGEHASEYTGILVGGSNILTPAETSSISPFRLDSGVQPEEIDLDNVIVEEFRLPRKYARPLAKAQIEALEASACTQYVPNRCRNMKVNVQIQKMASQPVLLPVWIMAYTYKNQAYRVLINGQTGKLAGTAPFAYGKLTVVVAAVIAIIILIVVAILVANR